MKIDWLIVGAGFTGCILAEQIASRLDQNVLIVEKRDHIGGNAYDCYDENGVLAHQYGPHLFHTNSKKVWDYLSTFTEWLFYQHHVLAVIDGKKVPVPFNLNSLHMLFPIGYANKMEMKLIDRYGLGKKVPILEMIEDSDEEIQQLADFVYKKVFLGYTLKQWGIDPKNLDSSVTARVPIHISRDDRYFQDKYQAVPKSGYTAMFKNIIKNPNIKILLKTDYKELKDRFSAAKMVYTGPIDEFFDYKYGELPYRSLNFKSIHHSNTDYYQETSQINYPNDYDFTRITEYKHITQQKTAGTTIMVEEACPYLRGMNDPYYPIPNKEHTELYRKYHAEADKIKNRVLFIGRLAEYRYYNMDQVVARALQTFERQIINK
ncbi:UDP-galactopyranose mutase [Pseudalkalibacillus salsuginis]|uniref:UDP-galactopyranose mutase n=1 Tax=Pseudalkalibacillus salsuginis TaxID=2910972 RepID=UPI001F4060E6|nr:UDP-galactopyranose mutase [Pseudalkalibacillus salsuginis]MCF6409169.1 UDP-galactopyranose mutase [Pseudalkalibacillus salsuginis]